jgi:prevent-host-death family protein
MKPSTQIKPISHLKAHTAEMVRRPSEELEPPIITQNGEAKVVMQDVKSCGETQETLALLKILALGDRQIDEGKVEPAEAVLARLRAGKPVRARDRRRQTGPAKPAVSRVLQG